MAAEAAHAVDYSCRVEVNGQFPPRQNEDWRRVEDETSAFWSTTVWPRP